MQLHDKNIIVELVGLPGAGKSTITGRLVPLLSQTIGVENYLDYHRRLIGSTAGKLNFLLFLLWNHRDVYDLITSIRRDIPLNRYSRGRIFKLLILIFAINRYYSKSPKPALIFDQGLAQMIASIYVPHGQTDNDSIQLVFEKVFSLLPTGNEYVLVRVHATLETAISRIREREKATCEFKSLSDMELSAVLTGYLFFFETLDCDLSVSSDSAVETNVKLIYDFLSK